MRVEGLSTSGIWVYSPFIKVSNFENGAINQVIYLDTTTHISLLADNDTTLRAAKANGWAKIEVYGIV